MIPVSVEYVWNNLFQREKYGRKCMFVIWIYREMLMNIQRRKRDTNTEKCYSKIQRSAI